MSEGEFAGMVWWESPGFFAGLQDVSFDSSCVAGDSCLIVECFEWATFQLASNDTQCFILASFKGVDDCVREPGLPSRATVVWSAAYVLCTVQFGEMFLIPPPFRVAH